MTGSLARWIRDADTVRHLDHFQITETALDLAHIRSQADDYYVSLVGALFESMRAETTTPDDWARLGNAFASFTAKDPATMFPSARVSKVEAALYAAAAFYHGGFPASAYLTARTQHSAQIDATGSLAACFDLLGRPQVMRSSLGEQVRTALLLGDMSHLNELGEAAAAAAVAGLAAGPDEWIPARLLKRLLDTFLQTNVRAVLPDGGSNFWTPLVGSLVERFLGNSSRPRLTR